MQSSQPHTEANNRVVDDKDNTLLEDVEMKEASREEARHGNANKRKASTSARSKGWEEFSVERIEEINPPTKNEKRRKIKVDSEKKCTTFLKNHSSSCLRKDEATVSRHGVLIKDDSKTNGTASSKSHSSSCLQAGEDSVNQLVLSDEDESDGTGSLTSWKFNPQSVKFKLCEKVIRDEHFLENLIFKIPSRKTIREGCINPFSRKKLSLKSFFRKNCRGKVSITADCWTAINNTNFICVTAHCIDKNWSLHRKIISFRKLCSHKGDDIGAAIIQSLEDWGMKNVLCCTMDNASANDDAIRYLKPFLERWDSSVLDGRYLHMRCIAHILNLVMSEGIKEIDMSVRRVREAVKWIKASPSRLERFKEAVKAHNLDWTNSLCLDVPTRWNSTYLMLESALRYDKAFKFFAFGESNPNFVHDLNQKMHEDEPIGVPQDEDWVIIGAMLEYLERFYELTNLISDTKYVTSPLIFAEMCDIFDGIKNLESNEDIQINTMATRMRRKVEKHLMEEEEDVNMKINKMLYIAALLDPRQKMKHVEKCLKTVYNEQRATELVGVVRNSLNELFEFYKRRRMTLTRPPLDTPTTEVTQPSGQRARLRGSCSLLQASVDDLESDEDDSLEIVLYFTEKLRKTTATKIAKFDILQWWLRNGSRFPILASMAKDVLAIPVSSVTSECAFSTRGRVLSQLRSSLTPDIVEALICVENWLSYSSANAFLNNEEDVSEAEVEKEFEIVLAELGTGGGTTENARTELSGRGRTTENAQTNRSAGGRTTESAQSNLTAVSRV